MKRIVFGMVAGFFAFPALAQPSGCAAFKKDKQRLACYDNVALGAEKPAALATAPKAEKPGERTPFKSGSWHVKQQLDAMTDKKTCTALHNNAWTVQGTATNFYVSFRGRGGVKAYTLRVDDNPADSLQLASDTEKNISAVVLEPSFERIYNGNRLRLQVSTILGGLLVEDINLAGFKEAVDYIRANCQA